MPSPSDHDHGIEHEPHLRGEPAKLDPSEVATERAFDNTTDQSGRQEDLARHSVFNEPAAVRQDSATDQTAIVKSFDQDWSCDRCGYNLRGLKIDAPCPECGRVPQYTPPPPGTSNYGQWLSKKIAMTSTWTNYSTMLFAAVAGGIWAVVGAMLTANFGVWGIAVVGPITEEVMKIAIVAGTVERHPYLFRHKSQIWFATLASAAGFAIIENVLYLHFYIPDASPNLVLWRWSVCSLLHIGCTAVATIGVVKVWDRSIRELREPHLGPAGPPVLLAVVLHGAYNTLALLAASAGFEF